MLEHTRKHDLERNVKWWGVQVNDTRIFILFADAFLPASMKEQPVRGSMVMQYRERSSSFSVGKGTEVKVHAVGKVIKVHAVQRLKFMQ